MLKTTVMGNKGLLVISIQAGISTIPCFGLRVNNSVHYLYSLSRIYLNINLFYLSLHQSMELIICNDSDPEKRLTHFMVLGILKISESTPSALLSFPGVDKG